MRRERGKWFLLFAGFAAIALTSLALAQTDAATRQSGITALSSNSQAEVPVVTPTCEPGWRVVGSPNIGSGQNVLQKVAVVSSNDAWAVGQYNNAGSNRTLIEHWNGAQWNVMPSPNAGVGNNNLEDIVVVAPNDIWAVGGYIVAGMYQTLALHWNGTQWNVVPSPNSGSGYNFLRSVSALGSDNVWAVGFYCPGDCFAGSLPGQTLIEHWNGAAWTIMPSPNTQDVNSYLWAVTAISGNDIWAMGIHNSCFGCASQTLAMHYDGSLWTIVPSPNGGSSTNSIYDAFAIASNDVWAVGHYYVPGPDQWRTMTLHWDGTQWSVVPSPNVGTGNNQLYGLGGRAANDLWAVGSAGSPDNTLVLHWNGTQWNIAPGTGAGILNGVAASSANSAWAVGYTGNRTLIMSYSPYCMGSTTTPTAMRTATALPSRTPPPSPLPCQGCNLRVEDVYIACNVDGTVQWVAVVRNSSTCNVLAPWTSNLELKRGGGPFQVVRTQNGKASFAPGLSVVRGDFCYPFPPDSRAIRDEFSLAVMDDGGSPDGRCRPSQNSHQITPCTVMPPCAVPSPVPTGVNVDPNK